MRLIECSLTRFHRPYPPHIVKPRTTPVKPTRTAQQTDMPCLGSVWTMRGGAKGELMSQHSKPRRAPDRQAEMEHTLDEGKRACCARLGGGLRFLFVLFPLALQRKSPPVKGSLPLRVLPHFYLGRPQGCCGFAA